jgi:hypothetical protein
MDKGRNVGMRRGDAERPQESGVAAPGRGGRMSRQRKTTAVMRLLRGEDYLAVRSAIAPGASLSPVTDPRHKILRRATRHRAHPSTLPS